MSESSAIFSPTASHFLLFFFLFFFCDQGSQGCWAMTWTTSAAARAGRWLAAVHPPSAIKSSRLAFGPQIFFFVVFPTDGRQIIATNLAKLWRLTCFFCWSKVTTRTVADLSACSRRKTCSCAIFRQCFFGTNFEPNLGTTGELAVGRL